MPSFRRALPVLVALVLFASSALATTVVPQSLDSLTDSADLVVRGVVEAVEGHAEVAGQPFRLARIRVDESLAGRAPGRLAVRLPGGATLSGRPYLAVGVPELVVGDEVLLFLSRVPPGVAGRATRPAGGELAGARARVAPAAGPPAAEQWIPVSLAVGTYHVRRVEGDALAVHDPAARGMATAGPMPPGGLAPDSLALADLEARVTGRRAAQGRP